MKKIKLNSFLSGAGIYLIANILNGLIPFILLPVLTRYLEPKQYGEVAMFTTLLGALAAFTGVTFIGAANRKFYDKGLNKNEYSQYLGSSIQIAIFISVITFIVTLLFQEQISEWLAIKKTYVLAAVLVSFNSVIIRARLSQWLIRKKALNYGIFQISQSLLNMAISLILVVIFLNGSDGRINAQIITSVIFLILSFILLKKDNLVKISMFRKDYLKDAYKFGLPLILHTSGFFLLVTVDRFVLNRELGLKEVGLYMVSYQLVSAMGFIFDAVNKAYVPYLNECLTRNIYTEKIKLVKYIYMWYLFITIIVIISFLIGPKFLTLFAGEKYSEAGKIVGFLALAQGFKGMYLTVTNIILYTKKTKITASITITVGAINVLLLILLVKPYGIIGASIASALSMGLFFITTWYFSSKLIEMPWLLR